MLTSEFEFTLCLPEIGLIYSQENICIRIWIDTEGKQSNTPQNIYRTDKSDINRRPVYKLTREWVTKNTWLFL